MASDEIVVETVFGKVRGYVQEGVNVFKGIRYGASTAGAQRFRPPKAPEPWAGIVDVNAYGPPAPQARARGEQAPGASVPAVASLRPVRPAEQEPSEDCLFLNVWTAAVHPLEARPVMVWLHGGGFNAGSAAGPTSDGLNLARRQDVVVVSINHRLGALGYARLDSVSGGMFEHTGNLGSLDIILALSWVRDNITRFGGDPSRVTIFGESGGGFKVSALLGMPAAAGLFHRAIIESGPGPKVLEPADGDVAASLLLAELDIDPGKSQLISEVPFEALVLAQTRVEAQLQRKIQTLWRGFVPSLDVVDLPAHPFGPDATAFSADIPIINGFNRTELTLFADASYLAADDAEMRRRIEQLAADRTDTLVSLYRQLHPDASPARLLAYMHCDLVMVPFVSQMAARHDSRGAPSYVYRFDWETPVLDGALISPHTLEIPFVFDNIAAGSYLTDNLPSASALAKRISTAWVNFAATGDPNGAPELPHWPTFSAEAPAMMVFNDSSAVADSPYRAQHELLDEIVAALA